MAAEDGRAVEAVDELAVVTLSLLTFHVVGRLHGQYYQ